MPFFSLEKPIICKILEYHIVNVRKLDYKFGEAKINVKYIFILWDVSMMHKCVSKMLLYSKEFGIFINGIFF